MNEQYKIRETKFFLAKMEESFHDRETFRYYLSAFLLPHHYIKEMEKFVQVGIEEGILSG